MSSQLDDTDDAANAFNVQWSNFVQKLAKKIKKEIYINSQSPLYFFWKNIVWFLAHFLTKIWPYVCNRERSSNIDENTPLINEEEKTNRTTSSTLTCFRNHKWKLILIVIIVAIAVALVIYFTYSVVTYGAIQLIVFEFNVWGMPGGIGKTHASEK